MLPETRTRLETQQKSWNTMTGLVFAPHPAVQQAIQANAGRKVRAPHAGKIASMIELHCAVEIIVMRRAGLGQFRAARL
jgi:hypothetical protein